MSKKIKRSPKHEFSAQNAVVGLGIGLALAPFTGGSSLLFTAFHVAGGAAMTVYEENFLDDKQTELDLDK